MVCTLAIVQSISAGPPETITVYVATHGPYVREIIEGISVRGASRGQLFGSATRSEFSFTLYRHSEYVTGITYGYHTRRSGILFYFYVGFFRKQLFE